MVILTEQIEIPASYEKMEAWAANFEEEFVKWSPYHIECNLYNEKPLGVRYSKPEIKVL